MTEEPTLSELDYARPDRDSLQSEADALQAAFNAADTPDAQLALIYGWDARQAQLDTWQNQAYVAWAKDTSAAAEKAAWDELAPDRTGWNVAFLALVLASEHRDALAHAFGAHAFAIWEVQVSAFDPRIADLKRRESELDTRYNTLISSARVDFQGKSLRLSDLRGFYGDADRAVRLDCRQAQDRLLSGLRDELDAIYGELVTVRHDMALAMGETSYTPLGYKRLGRTDYGADQVAAFRKQILEELVPLCSRIYERRAERLGVDHVCVHDEPVKDLRGVPRPLGGHDWMVEQGRAMFEQLGPDFVAFYDTMNRRELMDLESRDGKIGGGFCESLPTAEVPFIFANFNGTEDDVRVFTHECGHAFQCWSSRKAVLRDYLWPTYEACEIHSMGLEFLTYGQMDLFFGDDAERFRQGHLESALTFLPYGALVDEFQHHVYANPHQTPDERAAMWRELERKWMPWRSYEGGHYPHFESGRFWQRQLHLYGMPFYYIDYCLAQVCAMQLWDRYVQDPDATLALYRRLCDMGGTLPFTGLLDQVGLESPFDDGVVASVVARAREALGLT
jgi:M3 family oligoendopeptidase